MLARKASCCLLVVLAAVGCGPMEPLPPIEPLAPLELTQPQPAALRGVAAVDLYGNLEQRGFAIRRDAGQIVCTSADRQLIAIGYVDGATLRSVSATATGPQAAEFLAFVASLPYTGSQPAESSAWVTSTIAAGSDSRRSVGGVVLRLENRQSWTLSIDPE